MDQSIKTERRMMKPLRKRHLQIWITWAVLMPAGIVFAWLAIPNTEPVKLLQLQNADLLPIIKKTTDKKDYTIHLRSNQQNTEWQLEWKNKTVLAVPSAVIYKVKGSDNDITKSELIGRIEARGDYVFPLPPDSAGYSRLHLVLYDFIHQQVIDSINFQP
jgi:hypothetical protein